MIDDETSLQTAASKHKCKPQLQKSMLLVGMRIFRKLFVHYFQLNMWLISVSYVLTADFPNAGCARLQRAPIIDRVNDNFTIDFTVTFHPQPTWVGELRNIPTLVLGGRKLRNSPTPLNCALGRTSFCYGQPPAHMGGGNT